MARSKVSNGGGRGNEDGGSISKPLQIKPSDIVIAVMGVTGAGKSTFINHLSDVEVPIGHGLQSFTSEVDFYPATLSDNRRIVLVDTPGFDDTYRSDTDVLRDLASWLNAAYSERIELTGIVYLHRISDTRLGGAGMKNLRMFKKLCGNDGLRSVILCTTMWKNDNLEEGKRREEELIENPDMWKGMIDHGSRVFRHDRGEESAKDIVEYLIRKKRPVTLDIQRDMVDRGLPLDETAAGKEVQAEIRKAREEYEKKLKYIEQDMKDAMRDQDEEYQRELRDYKAEVESKMRQGEADMQQLRASREQLEQQLKSYQEQHQQALQRLDAQAEELQELQEQRKQEKREQMEYAREQRDAMKRMESEHRREIAESRRSAPKSHSSQQPKVVYLPVYVEQPRRSKCILM